MEETLKDYIVSDPQIMMGKPVIRGTRLTVEQIRAALEFVTMVYKSDVVYPVGAFVVISPNAVRIRTARS